MNDKNGIRYNDFVFIRSYAYKNEVTAPFVKTVTENNNGRISPLLTGLT